MRKGFPILEKQGLLVWDPVVLNFSAILCTLSLNLKKTLTRIKPLTLIQRLGGYGGEFFTELAEKWIDRFEAGWQGMDDIPEIGLEYCENGKNGEIRIDDTHFKEVEQWSESFRLELVAETNKRTLESLAPRESLKEQVREINSRCFSRFC